MMSPQTRRMVCIVGAPRSGTTSLFTYLSDHPDVHFSRVKEPHFFAQFDLTASDTASLRHRVENDYLQRYFPGWGADQRVLAEGSVSYLYVPERMEPILRLWPDAKFVIAVRDPLEMLPSLHLRLLCNGDETERDFERAWALASERRLGRHVPRTCIDARCLDYERLGRIGSHVERFTEVVGRERCFVSVFDDLSADPEGVYRQLLEFLELPYHPREDFAPQRVSRHFRSGLLQRFLKRPPIARSVLVGEKFRRRLVAQPDKPASLPVQLIFAARKRILAWNAVETKPSALHPALRMEIRQRLQDDVRLLSRVIGRNLDHWLAPGEAKAEPIMAWNLARRGNAAVRQRAEQRLEQGQPWQAGERALAGSRVGTFNGH